MTIQHRAIAHPTDEAAQSPAPPHGQISQRRSPSPTSDGQPHNALLETSPAPYGQVWERGVGDGPKRCCETCPDTCPDCPITYPELAINRQISQQRSPSPTSDGQPHNALLETSPAPYGQVWERGVGDDPKRCCETCPDNLITPTNGADYDYIHHILIGSPQGVTDAINRLHLGHRIERHRWTPLIPIREAGIHITPAQGQVISYLIQQRPTASQQ